MKDNFKGVALNSNTKTTSFCFDFVRCCLVAGAASIVGLLAMVLIPPVAILFIGNALLQSWQRRYTFYPHRSGPAWFVILTALAAVAGVFMLIYSLVGLRLALSGQWLLALLVGLLALSAVFPAQRKQVNEVFKWAYLSFDRRVLAIAIAFIHGTHEAAISSRQAALTLLVWLGLGVMAISALFASLINPLVDVLPFLEHKATDKTVRHLIISLMGMFIVFGALIAFRAVLLFSKHPKSGSGIPRIHGFTFQGKAALVGDLGIAHLSDLHIPHDGRLTENAEWRPNLLDRCVSALDTAHKVTPLGAVVFSGDVTDTGHELAWRSFVSKFAAYKEQSILAPGNHDLNIVGYGVPSIFLVADEQHMAGRWQRLVNYMDAASEVMGTRAHVWRNGGLSHLAVAWDEVKRNFEETRIPQYQPAIALFPFVVSVPGLDEHVKFIVWNTVRSSALALNNSYGNVGNEQFANFEAIASHFAKNDGQVSYIHVMHHKLGFPATPLLRHHKGEGADSACGLVAGIFRALKHRVQIAGMVMLNAGSTINVVAVGGSSVVLHGHHHASFWGEIEHQGKTMHVVSAPSTTLGTEMSESGSPVGLGFDVLELTTIAGGCALAAPPIRVMI